MRGDARTSHRRPLVGQGVEEADAPVPKPGQVIVDVHRVGVCGTDAELFSGELPYFAQGKSRFPLRPGHEWCGVVSAVGQAADESWLGVRVTGDTMLGCGRCRRCRAGHGHVCADRREVGIMGWPGALAEKVLVPAASLRRLPASVDDTAGALVEPGGNAYRAAAAAHAGPGKRILVWGPGTIGLLAVAFARAAVIDCTNDDTVPSSALTLVEPAGRMVYIGVSPRPSRIDSRDLVLSDLTAVGILGASAGLAQAIEHYADGRVTPGGLVSVVAGLDRAADALAGRLDPAPGTKIQIDPRLGG
jgi:threonine dehydrogenase-like Zn-dependent dehydrogenase